MLVIMDKFSVQEIFGEEIENLWNNKIFQRVPLWERGYAISDQIKCKSLLFVGINPSYYIKNDKEERFFMTIKAIAISTNLLKFPNG
jgi:hypothetical protein